VNKLTTLCLAAALTLPLACQTPTAEDWRPSTELAADWLANKGLGLSGPMPSVAVRWPHELQDAANDETREWARGGEIRALTYPVLRVVQFSNRLDPERHRSVAVRELAGIVCFERGWCQGMTRAQQEDWIGRVQAEYEAEQN